MKRNPVFLAISLLVFVATLTVVLRSQRPTTRTQVAISVPVQVAPSPESTTPSAAELEQMRSKVRQLRRGNEALEKRNKNRAAEAVVKAEAAKQTLGEKINRSSIPAPLKDVTKGLVNSHIDKGIKKLTTRNSLTIEQMEKMSVAELKEVLNRERQESARVERENAQKQAAYDAVRKTVGGITEK